MTPTNIISYIKPDHRLPQTGDGSDMGLETEVSAILRYYILDRIYYLTETVGVLIRLERS